MRHRSYWPLMVGLLLLIGIGAVLFHLGSVGGVFVAAVGLVSLAWTVGAGR